MIKEYRVNETEVFNSGINAVKLEATEFIGILRFTPKYSKCDPISMWGHWTLRDEGVIGPKPWKVWCNEGLYRHGINETICEIVRIDKLIK